ncbi:MAG: DNA polymerase I [bacterium]|nr:DNA polymerase I [bacterium]
MPNLSTKDGTPTGGVFGFATLALEIIKRLEPDYVAVAWDKPKTNIRKRLEIYPEYKAGRKPAPPDFYEQIPILHQLLDALGWPLYELDDYEADDIIGALAKQASVLGIETIMVTSDMDMLQVIDENTHLYALKKGLSNIEMFNPKSFEEKYKIKPEQFLDLKSLMGDSSDNIPGVPGIGKKGATDLLQEFETIDGVYENLGLIKDSVAKKLAEGKDSAYMSKKIASIFFDAPIKLDLKEVDGSKCKPAEVRKILKELEFRSLLRQSSNIWNGDIEDEEEPTDAVKLVVGKDVFIDSIEKFEAIKLSKENLVVVHTNSDKHGKNPKTLSLAFDSDQTFVIDIQKIGARTIKKELGEFLENARLIGYDVKSTLQVLFELGIDAKLVEHDVMVGAFLINSLRRDKSLHDLAGADLNVYLKEDDHTHSDVIAIVRELHKKQVKQLKEMPKVEELAHTIEWPVIYVLARMEYVGMEINKDKIKKLSEKVEDMISDLQQKIWGFADKEFNISSPSQLAVLLFEDLGLPTEGVKKGKTGYSTAAVELAKLKGQHEIIDLISQYREVTKLKNTYIDPLPEMVDENSRLHSTFSLTMAQTGRLSSSDPNLQNIPVRTELGKKIREAFEAKDDHVFIQADYSQFELRLAAYLCGDKDLIDQFNRDIDVHTTTAAEVYDRKPEDISKNMRRDAKVVNFGVMYGLSTHGLVAATGMSYAQAKHFISKYFEVRPKLKEYIDSVKQQAKEQGYVENIYGRRRPTPDVQSSNFMVREGGLRAAVNMPFQGSAADIMKKAMVQVQEKLDDDCVMLLQIHDSIIVECPIAKKKQVAKMMKETMEGVIDLPVKLTVDTETGDNWGEL